MTIEQRDPRSIFSSLVCVFSMYLLGLQVISYHLQDETFTMLLLDSFCVGFLLSFSETLSALWLKHRKVLVSQLGDVLLCN